MLDLKFWKFWLMGSNFDVGQSPKFDPMGQNFQNLKSSIFEAWVCHFFVFENFDQNLAKFDQILTQNLVKIDQNGHVRSF